MTSSWVRGQRSAVPSPEVPLGQDLVHGLESPSCFFFFFFFAVLGFELRAYTLRHSTSSFYNEIFEIGSCELFTQAGFEL
jgi:hypothetical protein